jgi:heme oxygenase
MKQLPNALLRLNLATRSLHAAADRHWAELVEGDQAPTSSQYLHALVTTYGFEAPLEAALQYTPDFANLVDTAGRYRSGRIAQDLLSLGLTPGEVADTPQLVIEPFASVAEALGWLYVHERATLKHDGVRREVERRTPRLARATAYLGAYSGSVGVRFHDFGRLLDSHARSNGDHLVAAAYDAFATLFRWLDTTTTAHARQP